MQAVLLDKCRLLLTELGLASSDNTIAAYPLTGGVASDIAKVQVGEQMFCVKFALPKLKVQADWFAPVHRNSAEYAWLEVAATLAPENAVTLLGQSRHLHGFAMEYLESDDASLWKTLLLNESPAPGAASRVGALVGKVHVASTRPGFNTKPFQNKDDFNAIRIEPYLLHTASVHNNIASELHEIASQLHNNAQVLIHGDVSPKNIFLRNKEPVVLDAECATMGDASFDVSFCLNHLVLKAMHLPKSREHYLKYAMQLWQAYHPYVSWESIDELECRVCRLLPALMLARVDGKSPVEYLSENEKQQIRAIAIPLITSPVTQLNELLERIGGADVSISNA